MSGVFVDETPSVTCTHGSHRADEPCRRCLAREQLDVWAEERRRTRITRWIRLTERVVVGGFLWLATAYFLAHWLVAAGVGKP